MHKKSLIILISLLLVNCSKKNQSDLAEKQFKLSENASVNMEIKKLQNSLPLAKTDIEKAEIYTKIAYIHDEKGDTISSIKSAVDAIKYQPNQYLSHYLLGKSYVAAGRYNEALYELEVSIGIKNDFAPSWFELGNAHYKKLNYAKAKESYKKAAAIDMSMIEAYNNLGVLSTITGDLAEAEKYLKKCISLNSNYASAYKNLGILYDTKMQKGPAAIESYRKYLSLRPDCPERSLVKLWISAIGDKK